MPISMYQASVPLLLRAYTNLSAVLEKGAAHAEAKKLDEASLIGFRLYPDMFPLARQVQVACDIGKNGISRLAGIDPPKFEDTEKTFAELIERVAKTMAFLKQIPASAIDGSEDKDLLVPMRGTPMPFKGLPYLQGFVLPNVYFHSTTTYNILRHNGVELGKMDFIGKP